MSIPVIITDGQTTLSFVGGKLPIDLDLTGLTVNATFPATVNTSVTNNVTVNDVRSTVNVSLTGSKDVTGNVLVTSGNIAASLSAASVTGNIPVDIQAFSDTLTVNNIIATSNVSLTGAKDVTGNVVVSQATARSEDVV